MRRWRSPAQTGHARSGFTAGGAFGLEAFQYALLEYLHLLLGVLEGVLAELQEARSTLVRGQRFVERQLPAFHGGNDLLELRKRGLEGGGEFRGHRNDVRGLIQPV